GDTSEFLLVLLDLPLERSVLREEDKSNEPDAVIRVVEELDCKDVETVIALDGTRLLELVSVGLPVLELLDNDEIDRLASESIEELLEEAMLIARIVLPLEELSEISEETPELVEDEAELDIVVMDAMVLDVLLVELVLEIDVTGPEVEFANTIDELASR
ncbi:MAG: hypothetical protein Q9192_006151, partial [Flavoplaca navasiana]